MQSTKTDGKLLLRRPTGDTTGVVLKYSRHQSDRMRAVAASLQFEGRKAPLSLLAARSIGIYLDNLEDARINDPARYAGELVALRRMLTKTPQPSKKRKAPAA